MSKPPTVWATAPPRLCASSTRRHPHGQMRPLQDPDYLQVTTGRCSIVIKVEGEVETSSSISRAVSHCVSAREDDTVTTSRRPS
jgi:hypothetical protein